MSQLISYLIVLSIIYARKLYIIIKYTKLKNITPYVDISNIGKSEYDFEPILRQPLKLVANTDGGGHGPSTLRAERVELADA